MDKMGTWWLSSEKDPRWNFEKREVINAPTNGDPVLDKILELRRTLGNPPEDLKWGFKED